MPHGGPSELILVVGMHRSGTSALTRVLSLCGAALPRDISEPGDDNPTGHWESPPAKDLNDGFLEARGSAWDDAGLAFRNPPRGDAFARDVAPSDRYVLAIENLLAHQAERGRTVVLKEPRITILLRYWLTAAKRAGFTPKAIHIFRHPADVAASLAVRNGIPFEHACALWRKYNLLGERDSRGVARAFVSYEALMRDWQTEIARCVREVGTELVPGPETRAAVRAFLAPELHHHRGGAVDARAAASEHWQPTLETYTELARAAAGDPNRAAFDALFDAYFDAYAESTSVATALGR